MKWSDGRSLHMPGVSNSQVQGLRSPDYSGHVQAEIIIVQHQLLVFGGTASVMYS